MSRETHVQFCEGLGVQFPGATHLVVSFENRIEAERFLKAFRERLAKVRTGTTSGENATDRVWAVRRPRSGEAWRREAGDLYVPGLYALSLTKIPCGLPQMSFPEAKRKALADRGPV